MPSFQREHIVFTDRTQRFPYTSVSSGRSNILPRTNIDRREHGNKLNDELATARETFKQEDDPDFVYLVFKSEINFLLDLDKFDSKNIQTTRLIRTMLIIIP